MARLLGNQNSTFLSFESGAYGTTLDTGIWPGCVNNFEPDDTQNVIKKRCQGNSTRKLNSFINTKEDNGGTLTYNPQDWRMLAFALGKNVDTDPGSPAFYTHTLTQLESNEISYHASGTPTIFNSFGLETAQRFNPTGGNLTNYYKGCVVNQLTISSTQGDLIECTAEIFASTNAYSSGAMTLSAADVSNRVFIYADTQIHYPSGTLVDTKTWELVINNNFDRDGAHVHNGSKNIIAPQAQEADNTLTFTMDAESTLAPVLYANWKSGGDVTENAMILINNVHGVGASGTSSISCSGCLIDEFSKPSPAEGINEWSLTLIPKNVTAVIEDDVEKYNAW